MFLDNEIRVERHVTVVNAGTSLDETLRRYTSWPRLQILIAWLLRFTDYIRSQKISPEQRGINLEDTRRSTRKIVQLVQRQSFPEEIDSLGKGRPIKGNSKLANLQPVMINGTLCLGGRVRHAPISFSAAHPMLLPKNRPVSTLIVRHYHHVLGDADREHVLSTLRQRF